MHTLDFVLKIAASKDWEDAMSVDPIAATLQGPTDVSVTRVAGAPIAEISIPGVLELLERWRSEGQDRMVLLRDVHGAMCARNQAKVRSAQEAADLVLPDGMPLVWAVRLAGGSGIDRCCGIDLLPEALRHGLALGWRHYFYGASPGVAEALKNEMTARHPGLKVVGTYCPPFRPLTPEQDEEILRQIRAASPDFVWVSLSTPKQDLWMHDHIGKLGGVTMIGVGGAFEINAGQIRRAPRWMQRMGLEWLARLAQEPRRLWKRYLSTLPAFAIITLSEILCARLSPSVPGSGRTK